MWTYSKTLTWLKDVRAGDILVWENTETKEIGECKVLKITPTGKIRTDIGLFSDGWHNGKWIIGKKDELKTYAQWRPVFEEESGVKVVDDDGGRLIMVEGKIDQPLTKEEAFKYFCRNTINGIPKTNK